MIIFQKLQQIKEMIMELVVCWTIITSKHIITMDLRKQQALDANPKAMQQINFSRYPKYNALIFFVIEEAKETVLDFSRETVKVF